MKIAGRITVAIGNGSDVCVSAVRERFVRALRAEKVGNIAEVGNSIRYRRGYSLYNRDPSSLAIFDPGSFSISKVDRSIVVTYAFGISPMWLHISVFTSGIIIFSWILVQNPNLFWRVVAFLVSIILLYPLGMAMTVFGARRWLRSVIGAAVRDGLARDESRKMM